MTVLDTISEDTLVFLQIHKRVWPTAQRDALFWSHMRNVASSDALQDGQTESSSNYHDTWIVCNRSTEHSDAPVSFILNIVLSIRYLPFFCE